jgi:RNA polymerase sigma-70 factor, ECF subfamily
MISDQQFTDEVTALSPTLFRLCISILHSEQDAQDAVQQGLMKAWAVKEGIRPDSFRAFLTRIIVNECHNIQRHRQRVVPAESPGAEVGTYLPEYSGLKAAIDGLPEKLRTPLLLYYMENYKEWEIARALGISVTAVKNRLFRARRSLKESLKDKEVSSGCESQI